MKKRSRLRLLASFIVVTQLLSADTQATNVLAMSNAGKVNTNASSNYAETAGDLIKRMEVSAPQVNTKTEGSDGTDSSGSDGHDYLDVIAAVEKADGTLTDILPEIIETRKKVQSVEEMMQSQIPKVTVVYSKNNEIENAYFKPRLTNIPDLEQNTLMNGFAAAYTGYFDLNRTSEYKPENKQSRALEILGYDFLLENESYNFMNDKYTAIQTDKYVNKGTVIMDIYKALGMSCYALSYYFEEDPGLSHLNSPVAEKLPGFINQVDNSRGLCKVYTTRTNKESYYELAENDLNIARNGMEKVITNGDFIVLLTRMMHFYGEPVLSDAEMNILLQVYGADIPAYLTPVQQEAYLYLKSRGVLNVELDYMMPLELDSMLDILMCVADENSRTDYKQIQLLMDIGDELINAGYFPRQINIAEEEAAIESNQVFDYADAAYYDYYIQITSKTRFVNTKGALTDYLFVPSIPSDPESAELETTKYHGIITAEDGTQYYHFAIEKMSLSSGYMKKSKTKFGKENYIQINTSDASDYPAYMWLEQGGGIYTFSSGPNRENGIILKRRAFKDGEFEGAVCSERVTKDKKKSKNANSTIKSFLNFLGMTATANALTLEQAMSVYSASTPRHTIILDNGDKITDYAKNIPGVDYSKVKLNKKKQLVVPGVPVVFDDYFYASIRRETSDRDLRAYPAIATLSGDVLLKYDDLVSNGVFYNGSIEMTPTPENYDDQILILESKYGQVKLNNATREVIVGNTLYKVKNDNTVLFKYVTNKGKSELWVDFRAAYGWTSNIISLELTGDGENYTIELKTLKGKKGNSKNSLKSVTVGYPDSFKTVVGTENTLIKPVKSGDSPKLILTSTYSLANWVIFQGVERSSGLPKDYAFIFYPKDAYSKNAPNDLKKMKDIVGYSVQTDNWVCRIIELSRGGNETVGQFQYLEDYGYVYNIPAWDMTDKMMEKYLRGEYLLPIFRKTDGSGELVNINVNVFKGYPYGSRPTGLSKMGIDIKGNEVTAGVLGEMIAAPAGVSAFYGGAMRRYYMADSNVIQMNQGDSGNRNVFYYGTLPCEVLRKPNGSIVANITFSGTKSWSHNWTIPKGQKFYLINILVASTMKDNEGNNTVVKNYFYRWAMYDSIPETEQSVLEGKEGSYTGVMDIINGEIKDKFSDFEGFSLEYLIGAIDSSSSWIILFTLEVMPYIGIILVTVLLGLSLVSDMKIVKLICEKTLDPVKLLTLGKVTIEEFTFNRAFIGLMLAYIGFALILDGNLLRVIQWLLTGYSVLTDVIKQL